MKQRTFIVSYDLVGVKDYKSLIKELKRLKASRRTLSTWTFVRLVPDDELATESVRKFRIHLEPFVDDDDRLFVGVLAASDGIRLLPQ